MPLFGAPQSGGNIVSGLNVTDMRTGDQLQLMVGTEAVVSGSASIHFVLGNRPEGGTITKTFSVRGCTNGTTWTIQGSLGPAIEDIPGSPTSPLTKFNATFQDVTFPDPITGNGVYTDTGAMTFYRFEIVTLQAGDAPIVDVRIG
jgi:hypothetical protein